MQQTEPLYSDGNRIPVNLTLLFALGVAAFGLYRGDEILIIAGLVVAVFTWFTTPRRYGIFPDRLVITYGVPRTHVVPFQRISRVELLTPARDERIRIWYVKGRPTTLQPKNAKEFHSRLEKALEEYFKIHPREVPS